MSQDSAYRYAGFPLTPSVFRETYLSLGTAEALRRSEVIHQVRTEHLGKQGLDANGEINSVAKKALATMAELGEAVSAGGRWKLTSASNVPPRPVEPAPDEEPLDYNEYVYVYFLPSYEELALAKGRETWPHKVGMTTTSVDSRLAGQVGTALPERPQVACVFETPLASTLEKAIHFVLTLRGKRIESAPGSEWFDTNPQEVLEIVNFIYGDTFEA